MPIIIDVDMGPAAGVHGGEIVAQGTPAELMKMHTLTTSYINGEREIAIPEKRREGNGKTLTLKKATGHNLKKVTVEFPLGKLIGVTGVSGSGKSSLITETVYSILNHHFFRYQKAPAAL